MCSLSCLKYVKAFEDFKKVVETCLDWMLQLNYEENIADFKRSYICLNHSVTLKYHTGFYNVEDFCEEKEQGSEICSKQAMESFHFNFKTL